MLACELELNHQYSHNTLQSNAQDHRPVIRDVVCVQNLNLAEEGSDCRVSELANGWMGDTERHCDFSGVIILSSLVYTLPTYLCSLPCCLVTY